MTEMIEMTETQWRDEMGLDDDDMVIKWPDSQDYLDIPEDIKEEEGIFLINDEDGLRLLGGSAYVVPKHVVENLEDYIGGQDG